VDWHKRFGDSVDSCATASHAARPQALYGIADSPVGLAAWLIDFPYSLDMIARSIDGMPEGLTPNDVLDNCTLYRLTNTGVSSSRL
jgi:hypothetical protein